MIKTCFTIFINYRLQQAFKYLTPAQREGRIYPMESILFSGASPQVIFILFLGLLFILEVVRSTLKGFYLGIVLLTGAIVGPGGFGVFGSFSQNNFLFELATGFIWFYLGLEAAHSLPKKRKTTVSIFTLFGMGITFSLALGAVFIPGLSWEPVVALALLSISRSLVPVSESEQPTLIQSRGGHLSTGSVSLQTLIIPCLGVMGLLFTSGKLSDPLFLLGGVVSVVLIAFIYPWILRPILRRYSEEAPWMTFFLLLGALGLGLLGQTLATWPLVFGVFLGAFGTGRLIPSGSVLKIRIDKTLQYLIIPPLMLLLGMGINPRSLLVSWEPWAWGGLLISAGFLGPIIASVVLRQWYSFNKEESYYAASLTTYHGLLGAVMFILILKYFPEMGSPGLILLVVSGFLGPWVNNFFAKQLMQKGATGNEVLEGSGKRIMVSLSNPDTASHLVELSLALHPKENLEPLFPVIVVQEGPDSEKAVLQAERMLTSAMARAVALGVPVVPVTSLDVNITAGLARVTRARRISLMILGWNGQYSVQRTIFGSVLDQTVKTSRLEIFVLKSSGTLMGVKRLQVGLPPLVETQPGFDQALADLIMLGANLGCQFTFYGLENTVNHLENRLRIWKTPGERSFEILNDWKTLLDRWKTRLGLQDGLVLFSLRQNQLAWQPSLDRCPRQVAQAFPNHPFLVIYPREGGDNPLEAETSGDEYFQTGVSEEIPKVILHMEDTSIMDALRQLLLIDFYGETLEKTTLLLNETVLTQPVELKPGVVLVHAHLNIVDDFSVYWGVNSQGWQIPDVSGPVKILVVLISPLAEGPEMHLRKLAELARLIGKTEWTEELLKAKNREDLGVKTLKFRV